jgi:hypothetical protein
MVLTRRSHQHVRRKPGTPKYHPSSLGDHTQGGLTVATVLSSSPPFAFIHRPMPAPTQLHVAHGWFGAGTKVLIPRSRSEVDAVGRGGCNDSRFQRRLCYEGERGVWRTGPTWRWHHAIKRERKEGPHAGDYGRRSEAERLAEGSHVSAPTARLALGYKRSWGENVGLDPGSRWSLFFFLFPISFLFSILISIQNQVLNSKFQI